MMIEVKGVVQAGAVDRRRAAIVFGRAEDAAGKACAAGEAGAVRSAWVNWSA
jgi:hypothetical protein